MPTDGMEPRHGRGLTGSRIGPRRTLDRHFQNAGEKRGCGTKSCIAQEARDFLLLARFTANLQPSPALLNYQ